MEMGLPLNWNESQLDISNFCKYVQINQQLVFATYLELLEYPYQTPRQSIHRKDLLLP